MHKASIPSLGDGSEESLIDYGEARGLRFEKCALPEELARQVLLLKAFRAE